MDYPITPLATTDFPVLLKEIPQPPKQLYRRGAAIPRDVPLLAVVGSRQYTNYGKTVVDHLITGLAGYQVGIVSGLAIGIDGLAHEAALRNDIYTIAVPGGGLDDTVLYPARHKRLAKEIMNRGGTLLSEYEPEQRAAVWTFPQRNRIVCGMCVATLVIEAAEKSGSLITARMAVDYNRELLVVPGDIFSPLSRGTHQFLKLGATPVAEAKDIVEVLGLEQMETAPLALSRVNLSPSEQKVLTLLATPTQTDDLIRALNLPTHEASALLMQLELKQIIGQTDGVYRPIV